MGGGGTGVHGMRQYAAGRCAPASARPASEHACRPACLLKPELADMLLWCQRNLASNKESTHSWAFVRGLGHAPAVAAALRWLECGQLEEQDTKGVHLCRQRVPPACELLGGCSQPRIDGGRLISRGTPPACHSVQGVAA